MGDKPIYVAAQCINRAAPISGRVLRWTEAWISQIVEMLAQTRLELSCQPWRGAVNQKAKNYLAAAR